MLWPALIFTSYVFVLTNACDSENCLNKLPTDVVSRLLDSCSKALNSSSSTPDLQWLLQDYTNLTQAYYKLQTELSAQSEELERLRAIMKTKYEVDLLPKTSSMPLQRQTRMTMSHDFSRIVTPLTTEEDNKLLRPVDCADHVTLGARESGVYEIFPFRCSCGHGVKVWCDMETAGGGWTVFLQRRNQTKQLNFTRPWSDYRDGFGDPDSEYWLGNEYLYYMTSVRRYELRTDLTDWQNGHRWAQWANMQVGDESSQFLLKVEKYSGVAGDAMAYHNGGKFHTFDRDTGTCAKDHLGGWWYKSCHHANPTGIYLEGTFAGKPRAVTWSKWLGNTYSLRDVRMMIRPALCGKPIPRVALNGHCGMCS